MSYSEVIKDIESKGFNQALVCTFEIADQAYSQVCSLEQQLECERQNMNEASADLESFIRYAAKNCDELIVDNNTIGKHVLRLIDNDVLYEIVKDEHDDKITWNAYRCNTTKRSEP